MNAREQRNDFRDFFLKMALPWKLPARKKESPDKDLKRYRRVWRYAVTLTLVVSLTPLVIMTGANYFLFRSNISAEIRYEVSRNVTNIARSLEFTIAERTSALKLLASEDTAAQLSSNASLRRTLENLKRSFGGFVDLGLIDSRGSQLFYNGPFDLEGADYADQDWFHEVKVRGMHLSDVFLGYRQFPHFGIAIRQNTEQGGFYVLRATADMALLTQHLTIADLGRGSDVFLINRDGVLQTSSLLHGEVLDHCTLPVPPYAQDTQVVEDYDEKGQTYILGYKYIDDTPFVLMLIKRRVDPVGEWLRTRTELFSFLAGSSILIIIVVLWSATVLVRRIRAADIQQAKLMHSAEYTNKMATIGRLAASVAHEINNPLAIINEKAGLLKDTVSAVPDYPNRAKVLGSVDSIIGSVARCSAVTHRLLGFTRRMERREERICLSDLLTNVLGFLGKETSHRNIMVVRDFAADVPQILSDRGMLQQVFLNIIDNAFAVIPDHGTLTLSLRLVPGDRVEVTIADDGPGIPGDQLESIFEPFYSTKGEFGTGLGLSITYDLVRKLGGRITVRSELGAGTVFTVVLPRKAPST
ncbi:two-component sensor histidine kinase [bacterium]|nr:two-component sensor histidine kinase [bacterium]MBU1675670.1 two-component sensor histidine kinase [bacterium]